MTLLNLDESSLLNNNNKKKKTIATCLVLLYGISALTMMMK